LTATAGAAQGDGMDRLAGRGWLAWDLALTVIMTVILLGEAVAEDAGPISFVLAGSMSISLAFRRSYPLTAYVINSVALVLIAANYYDAGLYVFANAIGLYSVGAYATRTRSVIGLVIGLSGVVAYWAVVPWKEIPWLPGSVVAAWALAWVAGQAEAQRRRAAAEMVRRAEEAEARRQIELTAALADERGRITREVHDIVGHALNVMMLQAGAARRVLGRDPEASSAALATVEAVGREALGELDHVLSSLDGDADRRPPPGIEDIDALADRFTDAGLPVRVVVEGEARPLPRAVQLTVYRVVQEALTNVVKHAGSESAEVAIAYGPTALALRVTDDGTAAAPMQPGRGLTGIRERVTALGGATDAGPGPGGGWMLRCSIPIAP
jgi:signal transduction histidine kinase